MLSVDRDLCIGFELDPGRHDRLLPSQRWYSPLQYYYGSLNIACGAEFPGGGAAMTKSPGLTQVDDAQKISSSCCRDVSMLQAAFLY